MSDAAQNSRVGSHFGRYYLKRLLGRGGMGEVYEAEDTVKERSVALKLLSPVLCQDPVFRERLQREARTAGRLQEPHVVPVHDYGEIDGLLFLEMRLIDGKDLSTLLKESGGFLEPPRAVAIVRQAASALDAAHAAGVIHRDIKPENILVTSDDFAYLVDFGIASATADEKLTSAGSAVGTWKYAAPERFNEGELTHSIDVYALACVLHECLTGAPPYRADSAGMLITAHLMNEVPRPSAVRSGVPAAFDEVIAKGMAKDPAERYASAGELAQAATEALSARDQDRAVEMVEHSEEVTLPEANDEPSPGAGGGPPLHELRPEPVAPPSYPGAWPGGSQHGAHPHMDGPQTPSAFPPGGSWPGQYRPLPPISPYRRPPSRGRGPVVAAVLVAVAVVAGLLFWLLPAESPPPDDAKSPAAERITTTTTPAVSTPPPAESQARLFGAIPGGYPPGACNPVTTPPNAFARLACGQNVDPDGPPTATYTLYPNLSTLRTAFNKIVQTSTVIECPGRIQSPGAWHRVAAPTQITGMLMCGLQHDSATVVWTNDAALVLGSVQSDPPGPNFDQLYSWWASHS